MTENMPSPEIKKETLDTKVPEGGEKAGEITQKADEAVKTGEEKSDAAKEVIKPHEYETILRDLQSELQIDANGNSPLPKNAKNTLLLRKLNAVAILAESDRTTEQAKDFNAKYILSQKSVSGVDNILSDLKQSKLIADNLCANFQFGPTTTESETKPSEPAKTEAPRPAPAGDTAVKSDKAPAVVKPEAPAPAPAEVSEKKGAEKPSCDTILAQLRDQLKPDADGDVFLPENEGNSLLIQKYNAISYVAETDLTQQYKDFNAQYILSQKSVDGISKIILDLQTRLPEKNVQLPDFYVKAQLVPPEKKSPSKPEAPQPKPAPEPAPKPDVTPSPAPKPAKEPEPVPVAPTPAPGKKEPEKSITEELLPEEKTAYEEIQAKLKESIASRPQSAADISALRELSNKLCVIRDNHKENPTLFAKIQSTITSAEKLINSWANHLDLAPAKKPAPEPTPEPTPAPQPEIKKPEPPKPQEPAKAPETPAKEPEKNRDDIRKEYIEKGNDLYEQQKYEEAIKVFQEGYEKTRNPGFLFRQGLAYEALEKFDDALRVYQEALKNYKNQDGKAYVSDRIDKVKGKKIRQQGYQKLDSDDAPKPEAVQPAPAPAPEPSKPEPAKEVPKPTKPQPEPVKEPEEPEKLEKVDKIPAMTPEQLEQAIQKIPDEMDVRSISLNPAMLKVSASKNLAAQIGARTLIALNLQGQGKTFKNESLLKWAKKRVDALNSEDVAKGTKIQISPEEKKQLIEDFIRENSDSAPISSPEKAEAPKSDISPAPESSEALQKDEVKYGTPAFDEWAESEKKESRVVNILNVAQLDLFLKNSGKVMLLVSDNACAPCEKIKPFMYQSSKTRSDVRFGIINDVQKLEQALITKYNLSTDVEKQAKIFMSHPQVLFLENGKLIQHADGFTGRVLNQTTRGDYNRIVDKTKGSPALNAAIDKVPFGSSESPMKKTPEDLERTQRMEKIQTFRKSVEDALGKIHPNKAIHVVVAGDAREGYDARRFILSVKIGQDSAESYSVFIKKDDTLVIKKNGYVLSAPNIKITDIKNIIPALDSSH